MNVIKRDKLPFVGLSHEFVGKEHGVGNSIFFVTALPGQSVRLHRHNYDELILVQEGHATRTVGKEQSEVNAGDNIVILAGTPHGFANTGDMTLRVDIHANPEFVTEWL